MTPRWRQMLRIGRSAARSADQRGTRFAGLVLASAVAALTLLSVVLSVATYEGRALRSEARAPVLTEYEPGAGPPRLLWRQDRDAVAGTAFTLIHIEPLTPDAPPPPGVREWPRPGEAVLSPALLDAGRQDGITTRYGPVSGRIAVAGLAVAGEKLAYVRPEAGFLTNDNAAEATGFGTSAPWGPRFGDDSGFRPLGELLSLIAVMLGLPAGLLLVIAARTGARARDRRTAVLRAMGASHRDLAVVAMGEALVPAALGCTAAAAATVVAMSVDVPLPWIGFTVDAAHLRAYAPEAFGAIAAAGATVLTTTALLHPAPGDSAGRPSTRTPTPRATRATAALFIPCQLLLAWFPALFAHTHHTVLSTLALAVGSIGSLATLPAVLALALGALGRAAAHLGLRHGAPGALLAGRWVQAGPGRLARLVAGSVIAAGLLAFIQVYPSIPSSFGTAARQAQADAGTSLLRIEVPDAHRFPAFVAALPPTTELVTLEPGTPTTLRGSCPALKALDLPCTATTIHPSHHPRAALLLAESSAMAPVRSLPAPPHLTRSTRTQDGPSPPLVAAVSTTTTALPTPELHKTAHATLGPGTEVLKIGEYALGGIMTTTQHVRWASFLGCIGVLIVAAAHGLNTLGEILRFARAISPVCVLTGSRRIYASVAAWTVLTPLCLAAPLAAGFAIWLTAPLTTPPRRGVLPPELITGTATTLLTLAALTAAWATHNACTTARRWRPTGD
ncbi:FtsX-like permease family protein [Streptomyces sp. NPDC055749]